MPELDDLPNDDLMNAVFADVRQEVAGFIRPAGAAAAVATVKRRRRNRAIAGGALAVALIVGPALAWAQNRPDDPPDVADPTPSVSASESAPATPSAGPSGSGSPSILDPGIPASQLRNMTLSVPPWPGSLDQNCPSGPVKFVDGKAETPQGAVPLQFAGDPVYVDADADRRNETVIRVDCPLQGLFTQVLAFSRGADGKVSTLGKVVGTHVDGSDVEKVWKIEAGGSGTVRVDVGDISPCCGIPADMPQHQWRAYGWDGQRFRQTGGQTTFPTNPKKTDLAVSIDPFRLTTTDNQSWVGQLTVTVTNKGPNAANRLEVMLNFPLDVTIKGPDGAACGATDASASNIYRCRFGRMPAGTTRQVRVEVTAIVDPTGRTTTVIAINGSTDGEGYPDLKQSDNLSDVVSR